MSTTLKNEAKRIAKELYLKGIVSNLEKRDAAESVVEQGLKLYAGLVQVDEEKKVRSNLDVELRGIDLETMADR